MTFSKSQADPDNVDRSNAELEFGFNGLFCAEVRDGFAELEAGGSGIQLVVDNTEFDGEILSCQLLVTFCLERAYIAGFNRIREAINVLMECPAMRQSASFSLSDPHKIYEEYEGDNRIEGWANTVRGSKTAYSEVFLEIPMTAYTANNQVYIRAVLEEYHSNVIEITLSDEVTITSYLDGMLHTPTYVDLG